MTESHPRSVRRREILVQGVALILLLAFVFPATFLRGEIISPANMLYLIPPWNHHVPNGWHDEHLHLMSDVLCAFRPYYVATRSALDNGEWPLWNPFEYWGVPLLANCQSAVFYPPRLLHAFLDIDVATTLYVLLKLWLCGMTAYVCARGMGLSIGPSRFFSVGWMLSSYNVIWCNWPLPDVSAWMPVAFLGCEFILSGKYRKGFLVLLTGATLILLAGHPETAFAFSSGLGFYFLIRVLWDFRRTRRLWGPLGVAAAAWGVALAICAAQLLPFLEYVAHASILQDRGGGRAYPFPAGVTSSFFIPKFFGTARDDNYWGDINANLYSSVYPGLVVWLAMALLLLKRGKTHPAARPLAVVAAMAILVAFNVPEAPWLQHTGVIRCYWVVFALFALPLLGALGFEKWTSTTRRVPEVLVTLVPVVAAIIVVGALWQFCRPLIHTLHMDWYIQKQFIIAGVLCAATLLYLAFSCRKDKSDGSDRSDRSNNWLGAKSLILPGLLACDLLISSLGWNATLPKKESFPRTDLTDYLQTLEKPSRIGAPEGHIPTGLLVSYGIEEWLGYDGLYPARIIKFTKTLGPDMWGPIEPVRGIDYFLDDPARSSEIPSKNLAQMERVAQKDGVDIYKNTKAFPRAFLVGGIRVVPDTNQMLALMKSQDFDPRKAVLTEPEFASKISHWAGAPDGASLGKATVLEHKSTRVTIHAEANDNCVLVLSDAYYPGWRATIDGAPTPVLPAYYAFRCVLLPKGTHEVRFIYAPSSFSIGLAISVLAMLGVCGYVLLGQRTKRT